MTAGSGGFSSSLPVNTLGEVVDLTDQVGGDNSLNWTAPEGNSTWRLIAWYERQANQRSCAGGLNATDYIGNGSWTVDHFSAEGGLAVPPCALWTSGVLTSRCRIKEAN